MRPVDYSCYAGASGFLSTPSDLVRFGLAAVTSNLPYADTSAMAAGVTEAFAGVRMDAESR